MTKGPTYTKELSRQGLQAYLVGKLKTMTYDMAKWPDSKSEFVARLAILVEVSHLGTPESFESKEQEFYTEFSKNRLTEINADPIVPEWAFHAVEIARKYMMP